MSIPIGAIFWPKGNNLNNLGRGPQGQAMYQISKAWAFCFQTWRFLKCFPISDHFLSQGHNLNNLGRSLLDGATYQISKTWAFWFQEDFLSFQLKKQTYSAPVI